MFKPSISKVLAALSLSVAVPVIFAQTPATPGPANPKEVGKPGTTANSGVGKSGALNSSDAKAADAPADGASGMKRRMDTMKNKNAATKASKPASAP